MKMMNDILQYVPYAVVVGAIFLMLLAGVGYTISRFRKAEKETLKR